MRVRLNLGLVHWPVYDRNRKLVATNVTNLDVHDIARVSRVYGVERYFIIHPMRDQLSFVSRLLDHWRVGEGKVFNPMRATALTMVETAESVEQSIEILSRDGKRPLVVGTTARDIPGVERISFRIFRSFLNAEPLSADDVEVWGPRLKGFDSVLLLFGTGFGMTTELLSQCDLLLEPMRGAPPLDYRHLSVRSAASICLDRLLGSW